MARKSRKNIMPQSAAPEIRISEEVNPLMYRLVTSGTEKAISDGRLTQKRRPASERCLIWHYLDAIQRRLPMP